MCEHAAVSATHFCCRAFGDSANSDTESDRMTASVWRSCPKTPSIPAMLRDRAKWYRYVTSSSKFVRPATLTCA